MKSKFLIPVFALFITTGFSQSVEESKVPEKAKAAFQKKFPGVSDVKWEKEGDNEFEAEFRAAGLGMSANFTAEGKWLETETEISFAQLPSAVSASFLKSHKHKTKLEAANIELASGKIIYEIEAPEGSKGSKEGSHEEDHGSKSREFFYDENGKELKGSK